MVGGSVGKGVALGGGSGVQVGHGVAVGAAGPGRATRIPLSTMVPTRKALMIIMTVSLVLRFRLFLLKIDLLLKCPRIIPYVAGGATRRSARV